MCDYIYLRKKESEKKKGGACLGRLGEEADDDGEGQLCIPLSLLLFEALVARVGCCGLEEEPLGVGLGDGALNGVMVVVVGVGF